MGREMRFLIYCILIAVLCAPMFAVSGLSLECDFNATDWRCAVATFGSVEGNSYSSLGAEVGTMNDGGYIGGFTETSYPKLIWGDFGIRGAHRQGGCYLFDEQRLAILTGCSISTFWRRYHLMATYTATAFVRDSVYRSISQWYFGFAVSLFLP